MTQHHPDLVHLEGQSWKCIHS